MREGTFGELAPIVSYIRVHALTSQELTPLLRAVSIDVILAVSHRHKPASSSRGMFAGHVTTDTVTVRKQYRKKAYGKSSIPSGLFNPVLRWMAIRNA